MFIKKILFLSRLVRICIQSLEKNDNKSKKIVFIKNEICLSKNTDFHAVLKSVEKVSKCTKKLLAKTFSTFTHVRQTCFAYTFFVHFWTTFCRSYILVLFQTLKPNT